LRLSTTGEWAEILAFLDHILEEEHHNSGVIKRLKLTRIKIADRSSFALNDHRS